MLAAGMRGRCTRGKLPQVGGDGREVVDRRLELERLRGLLDAVPNRLRCGMTARAGSLVLLAVAFAAIPAAAQAHQAGTAPGLTRLGLVSAQDVPGLAPAAVPAAAQRAWAAILPAPARSSAIVVVLRGTKLALVSRVAKTGGSAQAAALVRTLRRLSAARLSRLDSAAVRLGGLGPGRAQALWSVGGVVGQVSVLGGGKTGAAFARAAAARARARVTRALHETAWEKVLDQVRPDGSVSVETALQAFSLAIAPLPGVHVPAGPAGRIPDGTLAINWVLSKFDKLSKAQRAAVTQALGHGRRPAAHSYRVPARLSHRADDWQPNAQDQADAQHWASEISTKLGFPLKLTLHVGTTSVQDGSDAYTSVVNAKGNGDVDPPADCWVTVTPAGRSRGKAYLELVLAHEVFHCFQGEIAGVFYYEIPGWVTEGGANWAACNVVPAPVDDWDGAFTNYLTTPATQLFGREYDAEGFFSLLAQHGIDLWSRWPAIIKGGLHGSIVSYQAAVGTEQEPILWDWASSYKQHDLPSADWNVAGPCTPGQTARSQYPLTISNGTVAKIAADSWAIAQFIPFSSADVVSVSPDKGHVRVGSKKLDQRLSGTVDYCTSAQGDCTCPGSSAPPLTRIDANGGTLIALTGGPTGAGATVTGKSLDDYCKPKPASAACFVSEPTLRSLLGLAHSGVLLSSHANQVAKSFVCGIAAWNGAEPTSNQGAIQAARAGNAAAFGGITWAPGPSPQAWDGAGFGALVAGLKTHSAPIVPLWGGATGPVTGQSFTPDKSFGFGVTAWLMPNVPSSGLVSANACWWRPQTYSVICLGLEEQAGKPIVQHLNAIAAIAVPAILG